MARRGSLSKIKAAAIVAAEELFPGAVEYRLQMTEGEMKVWVYTAPATATLQSVGVKL
jgi:hypothetical protein